MAKIYMIDSENVGDSWIQLLSSMTEEDRLFVFYTDKSPYISYESLLQVIAYGSIPSFIKCHEGRNALDFQLVSELGYKIALMPSEEFIVVSDDNGFDAVVKYWSDKQYKIRRIGRKFCRSVPSYRKDVQNNERGREEQVKEEQVREEVKEAVNELAAEGLSAAPSVSEEPMPVVYEVFRDQTESVAELTAAASEQGAEEPVTAQQASGLEQIREPEEASDSDLDVEPEKGSDSEKAPEPKPAVKAEKTSDSEPAVKAEKVSDSKPAVKAEKVSDSKPSVKAEKVSDSKPAVKAEKVSDSKSAVKAEQESVLTEEQKAETQPQTPEELIRDIVYHCKSPQPEKDAKCVYELFYTLSMATLTEVNTALKIFIGNEEGNNIYRELKENQACRKALDDLYLPTQKERFLRYVGIVLERSDLQDLNAEELGKFLLRIPRKNLNSIRASMQKEFGSELGSKIYTVYKPHIKVLNKI